MDDNAIIELYFARSEQAIAETAVKYGGYCYRIAHQILDNREDSEESVQDTYLAAWRNMPPRRPSILATFLGKITRYISLNRWKQRHAVKRGGGQVPLALEELEECIAGADTESQFEGRELTRCLNRFLETLPPQERSVFVCRYWYLESIQDIGKQFDFTESKVKSMLFRTRGKLRAALEKEGLW